MKEAELKHYKRHCVKLEEELEKALQAILILRGKWQGSAFYCRYPILPAPPGTALKEMCKNYGIQAGDLICY